MTKQKRLILIPLLLVAGLLTYCWAIILTTDTLATWRHYAGLLLFIPLVILYFKSIPKLVIATGVYLLLGTFNLVAVTATIKVSWIKLGSDGLATPPVQLLFLGLFALYFILNFDTLVEMQLDYKEAKAAKVSTNKN